MTDAREQANKLMSDHLLVGRLSDRETLDALTEALAEAERRGRMDLEQANRIARDVAEQAIAELKQCREAREAEMGTAQSTIAGLQDDLEEALNQHAEIWAERNGWRSRAEIAEAELVRMRGLLSAIHKDAQRSWMEMWWVPPDVQEAICKLFQRT